MKNTIIIPLRFRWNLNKVKYQQGDNDFPGYIEKEVVFPISQIIEGLIEEHSEVEVILVRSTSEKRETEHLVDEAKEEISEVLSAKDVNVSFKTIDAPYSSERNKLSSLYRGLCESISAETNIYVDLTYGPKYMPLVLFCALNYAEKYLECNIKRIVYGLFDSVKGNVGVIGDFTPLYLLNTMGTMFDGTKDSFDVFAKTIL